MQKKYQAKSIVISRKPGRSADGLKTAFIGLFDENNPHLKGRAPFEVVEIREIEKVRIHDLRNVSYYLLGNDIVINNLKEITISREGNVVTVSGDQELPEVQ